MLNSVGEEERLEFVLPWSKNTMFQWLQSQTTTQAFPKTKVRFAVAKKSCERAADFGIPAHDIMVDPW